MTIKELQILRRWWKEDFRKIILERDKAERRYRIKHNLIEPTQKQLVKYYIKMAPKSEFPPNIAWDYPARIYEGLCVSVPSSILDILGESSDAFSVYEVMSKYGTNKAKDTNYHTEREYVNRGYSISRYMYEEDSYEEYSQRMSGIMKRHMLEEFAYDKGDFESDDEERTASFVENLS